MTEQPQSKPGVGTDAAEETGSTDEARAVGGTEAELAGTIDPAQPADEASSPA